MACIDCSPGYLCPELSTIMFECGSPALWCPAKSALPNATTLGYYTTPEDESQETIRTSQEVCEAGYECVGGVKTACMAGIAFQSSPGQGSCQMCSLCGPGKYMTSECTTTQDRGCQACKAGTYSLGKNAKVCLSCDSEGQYQDTANSSSCKSANAGFRPKSDRTGTIQCQAGRFSTGGSNTCEQCSDGTYSNTEGASGCNAAAA